MRLALMIEGQEDVTWEDWVALADACERAGVEALFRSDHYVSVMGATERGSLDAWGTICALAARTRTLRLGTLVSPASFRHPSILAKLVTTADHVSGGRVELGLGTGWSEIEHRAYGFPFRPLGERMDVLEEQLAIVRDGHWGEQRPWSFRGRHYEVVGLVAQPRPLQRPHPPLIVGGQAGPRSARLAARWADEYNLVLPAFDGIPAQRARLADACRQAGRAPLRLSAMTPFAVGADAAALAERRREIAAVQGGEAELPEGVAIAGTTEQVVERLRDYAAAGVERVFLQHLLHRDLETVELLGREIVPAVGSGV